MAELSDAIVAIIDGVRVYANSGSFSSGTIHFYGITK